MVRGYERYYQKASRSTRDPGLDGAWSPSLDMDALGLRAKWWRGPYEGPDGNNLCGNQILRSVRDESSRRPPRHRRDACSTAWRCRFLTARPSQDGRVIAEK